MQTHANVKPPTWPHLEIRRRSLAVLVVTAVLALHDSATAQWEIFEDSSVASVCGVVNVKGDGVWSHLGYEGGGHRVQRVPKTEAAGRIHTSAATVAVLPEPEQVDVDIDWNKDVEEFVSRAGGPGGQSVNKVESAIKLKHIETGVTVSMRDEKSQHKNRAKARRILTTRLYDHYQQIQNAERASTRKAMIGSGDRSERIRTYNFPQNRCTDHRIGLTLYNLNNVMLGELDEFVESLQRHDRSERLKNLSFAEQN